MATRTVTVGDLKRWLADKDDKMVFLTSYPDHAYVPVRFRVGNVVFNPETNEWYEHPGQPLEECELPGCEAREAIIVC